MKRRTRLSVEVLEDRLTPSFSPVVSYPAGAYPQALATADFNSDSILDVAVANTGSGTVSVLLGNADGTFQASNTLPTGHQPFSLAVGDFNGDGHLDLVTADVNREVADLTVLPGNGNGTFGAPTSYDASWFNGLSTVAAGDFNADGHLDLAAVSNRLEYNSGDGDYIGVLLGTGAGTFSTPQVWTPLSSAEYDTHSDSVVADFNADGKLDLALPSDFYETTRVVLGDGNGMFSSMSSFWTGNNGSWVEAADFNSDGKVDLAVAGDSSVCVMLGAGNGSFGTPQNYSAGSGSLSDLAAADFDGDGKLDVVTSDADTGTVSVLLGSGTGSLSYAAAYTVGASPSAIAVGDFNGDGRPDVATANAGSNSVSVLLNDGVWAPPAPPVPVVRIGDATVTEGNTGTRAATFTVTLSAPSSQPVTVAYATGNGTATAGGDFQAASGAVTFAPGETTKTITALINGDRLAEPNETFVVNLSSPTNATIADGQGVGTVFDDEPRISIGNVTKAEGRKGQKTLFTFTVTLSAAYDQAVTLSFRTLNGTATTGNGDYVARTGTLTFAPGETTKTITIEVKGDNKREADESFYLDLFGNSSNSLFTENRGTGTILNDD